MPILEKAGITHCQNCAASKEKVDNEVVQRV